LRQYQSDYFMFSKTRTQTREKKDIHIEEKNVEIPLCCKYFTVFYFSLTIKNNYCTICPNKLRIHFN